MGYKRGTRPISAPINKEPVAPIPADLEKEVINTTEELVEKAEIKEEPKEANAIIDGVDVALNVRKDPEVKPNNQIAILGKGVKIVVVDPDKTVKNKDGEWFKIRIKDAEPKEGYAMKKYIKIL